MDAYIFGADIYCADCGEDIRRKLDAKGKTPEDVEDENTYDSDDYPKGPYPDGGGEADEPQVCADCGVFLENDLTQEGVRYMEELIEDIEEGRSNSREVMEWAKFYGMPIEGGPKENPGRVGGKTGWRGYGAGKYDSVVDSYIDALVNEGWGDEELGDVEGFGHYVRLTGEPGFLMDHDAVPRIAQEHNDRLTDEEKRELDEVSGVIVSTDNQGFVHVDYFELKTHAWRAWKDLEREAEEFEAEGAEEQED